MCNAYMNSNNILLEKIQIIFPYLEIKKVTLIKYKTMTKVQTIHNFTF